MLPGERGRLHAAYGEALEGNRTLAGDPAAVPALLAYHWYAALDLPRALPATIEAARGAMVMRGRRCATWTGRCRSGRGWRMPGRAPGWT